MSFLGKKPADQVTSGQQIANNTITGNKLVDGIITATKMAAGAVIAHLGYTPVDQASLAGQVAFYGMSSAPTGWLKANGAAVSRTTYAALFAAIGTTYGGGDGSTTFNLPDLRGEFPRGFDDGRGVDAGRSIGSAQASSRVLFAVGTGTGGYNQTGYAGFRYHADSYGIQNNWDDGDTTTDQSTTADGTGGGIQNSRNFYRAIRPRNVALLACIRY